MQASGVSASVPASPASLLTLARSGNCKALSIWLNTLFRNQGIRVRAMHSQRRQDLTLHLYFCYPAQRDALIQAQADVMRRVGYRLWTLNSPVIQRVKVMAWQQGDRHLLWQQVLRINTPANLRHPLRQRRPHARKAIACRRWPLVLGGVTTTGLFTASLLTHLQDADAESPPTMPAANPPTVVQPVTPLLDSLMQPPTEPQRQFPSDIVPTAFQGQVVYEVTPANGEKVVALTFDDGPWPETTEQVLAILQRFEVPATFFVTGQQVEKLPQLAWRMVAEGHAIANHSWSHPMAEMDTATAIRELDHTNRLIERVTGTRPALFRPPGGNLNTRLTTYAKQTQNAVLMWSADSEDYYVSAPLIVDNVLRQVRPGGIVLLHDGGGNQQATVEALPQILTTLQRLGYRFVTVPELLHLAQPTANLSPSSPLLE